MSLIGGVRKPRSQASRPKRAGSDATVQRIADSLREEEDDGEHDQEFAMQARLAILAPGRATGKESDEGATTGTITPRSVGTGATLSGKSSAGHKVATPVGSEDGDGGGSGGGGGSSSGKRERGITAGGAGASRKELTEMPSARVKRILANRQSAARSKERKLAYISELEGQVSTLTMQLTSASMQLRSLQSDTASLGECNQALAQQALVLREHMSQRDSETAMLASELRRAQALLAAHNIPVSSGGFGAGGAAGLQLSPRGNGNAERCSPFPGAEPGLGTAKATFGRAAPEMGFQPPDGFRLPDGFRGGSGEGFRPPSDGRGGSGGLGDAVNHRAQLQQALERHQVQQRLWANSLGSAADNSKGASPSGAAADQAGLQQQLAAAAAAGRFFGAASSSSFLPGGLGSGIGSLTSGVSTNASLASLGGGGGGQDNGGASARQRTAQRAAKASEQLDAVMAGYGMHGGAGADGNHRPGGGGGFFSPGS